MMVILRTFIRLLGVSVPNVPNFGRKEGEVVVRIAIHLLDPN